MTIEEARKIAEPFRDDTWGWTYEPGDLDVVVDGRFTADQLEALAIVLRADQAEHKS